MIDFCESPPDFITATEDVDIEWDEPLFHDNSREPLTITQTHQFGRFKFGDTDVIYTATDSSGNTAQCKINIRLASMSTFHVINACYYAMNILISQDTPVLSPMIQSMVTRIVQSQSTLFTAPWLVMKASHLHSDPPETTSVT